MQLAWSNTWTRVAVSISYDDNDYTTGTSTTINDHLLERIGVTVIYPIYL